MLEILSDYLEDRSQVVRVSTSNSTKINVTCGVPRGFNLGSPLFCKLISYPKL